MKNLIMIQMHTNKNEKSEKNSDKETNLNKNLYNVIVRITLLATSENNAELNREKLYRIMNSKRYSNENQQNLERFLRECATAFQIKLFTYKKNLIRVAYVQDFLFDRSAKK